MRYLDFSELSLIAGRICRIMMVQLHEYVERLTGGLVSILVGVYWQLQHVVEIKQVVIL